MKRYDMVVNAREDWIEAYRLASSVMIDAQKLSKKFHSVHVADEEGLKALLVRGRLVYYRNAYWEGSLEW